jgi:hypothetical protein
VTAPDSHGRTERFSISALMNCVQRLQSPRSR